MVIFNYPFLHSNDQIDPCQVVECKMNKQDHIELFIIEVFIVSRCSQDVRRVFDGCQFYLWKVG